MQRSDDAARNLRAIYLGWKGWRWPFDATYAQWWGGLSLAALLALLFVFVIPCVIPAAGLTWLLSSLVKRARPYGAAWERPAFFAAWLIFIVSIYPDPALWLRPLGGIFAIAAILLALVFASLIAWKTGKHVNGETPVGYWFAVPGRIASGPRPFRPVNIDPSSLALTADAPYKRRRVRLSRKDRRNALSSQAPDAPHA